MRREIWRRMLPERLPLAPDIDLDAAARAELSGGEIKNAVLNSARIALCRDGASAIAQADLEEAIRLEIGGRWKREGGRRIGFCGDPAPMPLQPAKGGLDS
jgi:hypothetical protein